MKSALLAMAALFVSLGFLLSGIQTMTGYYAEPSGYGFHHIWFANLYVSVSLTVMASIAMVFLIRKIERRLF
jgi:hypothetical protein